MAIKSGALSRAFFEEPPYYEHEVLANLEEFNLKSDANSQSNSNNFANVLSGLDNSASSIISTISDESERSRIQAQIDAERIETGISETNFHLLDLNSGISSLDESIRESNYSLTEQMRESSNEIRVQIRKSSNDIQEQIYQSGINIVHQLEITNRSLASIDNNLLAINDSLKGIGSILSIILERINKPNEVQAIELADQIRTNLAIGKHEEALRITRKAMELCSTSITVTAYHLMTLSLFGDEELKNESAVVFKDFVNLINFKLFDSGSDTESVRDEIYYVAYPALFALSRSLGGIILNDAERLYASISGDKKATKMLLTKPLEDQATEVMTLHPSPLRELHWTTILTEEIVSNKSFEKLPRYIVKLANNNVLIKNELLYKANKELYNSNLLHSLLMKTWYKDTASYEELSCLDIFISMQPSNNIELDDRTLLLVNNYVKKQNLIIGKRLKEILSLFEINLKDDALNEKLFKTKKLHTLLDKTWHEDSASVEELDTLSTFVLMQPQHNIDLDDKTTVLIDRYVSKHKLSIHHKLKETIESLKSQINQYVEEEYTNNRKSYRAELDKIENKQLLILNNKSISYLKDLEESVTDAKAANASLDSQISKKKEEVISIENQISRKEKEVNAHEGHTLISESVYVVIVLITAPIVGYLGSYINNGPGSAWGIIQIPFNTILPGIPIGMLLSWVLKKINHYIHNQHIKSAINGKKNIATLNDKISKLKDSISSLSNEKIDFDSFRTEKKNKYHNELVKYARSNIHKPMQDFRSKLQSHYYHIASNYFINSSKEDKIAKEMSLLINNKHPNNFELSKNFLTQFGEIKNKFKVL